MTEPKEKAGKQEEGGEEEGGERGVPAVLGKGNFSASFPKTALGSLMERLCHSIRLFHPTV